MISHHPDVALLMSLSAGRLAAGPALVLGVHAERCSHCAAQLRAFDAVGGTLLERLDSEQLAPDALVRTLARIDSLDATVQADDPSAAAALEEESLPMPPSGLRWPRSLRSVAATAWRTLSPGVRWSRLTIAHARDSNVFLLRVAAGKALPRHSHRGGELTQVLHGAFNDGVGRFVAGDFDCADDGVHHQPVVTADGECICLTSVDGRIAFEGPLARLVGRVLKM